MDDETIIQTRLSFRDVAIRKYFAKYQDFLEKLGAKSLSECQGASREVLNELDSIELLVAKAELFFVMYQKDMESQEQRQQEIESEIEKTKEEIVNLQEKLLNEKTTLKYKGEYEEMAKVIANYRSRKELQTLIEETISAKTELEGKTNEMKGQIEEKKKQLELLTALLLELRVSGSAGQEQADGEEASKLGNEHMADA
eukprot:TRINITY_DN5992_c0_g4_i3.p1 TRINITY_DN5992_c0_g4~~TRINITY_DN5992_c0_g4_i3.p1  ORF type:complete len:199 (+),score=81.56 TRINITY_DN5992_c0_g4_i3:155-751(+)